MADRTVYVDGTTSGTPGTTGAHYATLAAAISGEVGAAANLVTGTAVLHIECCGFSGSAADDAAVDVTGFTVNSSYYVHIYGKVSERPAVNKWTTSGRYHLDASFGSSAALRVQNAYTKIDGLLVRNQYTGGYTAINVWGADAVEITESIARGGATAVSFTMDSGQTGLLRNSAAYGAGTNGVRNNSIGATLTMQNDVIDQSPTGVACDAGTINATNVYVANASTAEWSGAGTINRTTCAHSSATSYSGSTANVACSTSAGAYFTNVTAGSEDYHIGASSALKDAGTNLGGTFARDIDGALTGSTRNDIGIHEYEAGGATSSPSSLLTVGVG